jgi:ParB family transcriptional regulator, chromosome partitioning protein
MNTQTNMKADPTSDAAVTMLLQEVPFGDLHVSDLNCRTVIDEDSIQKLAENIRAKGLIQNLAGLREDSGRIGIVAGGRRLRALAFLQDDPEFQSIPVRVTSDINVAKAWAASENHLREALHPADEIREYGAMAEDGIPVPAISLAFGVSEAHVYRRLKLAGLPEAVLASLKADDITLSMAACFTLCDDEAHSLSVLERVRGDAVSTHSLKRLLKPASVKHTDRRAVFVGEAAYLEAGGRLTRDLFAEEVLFDDPDILDELFAAKLEKAAANIKSEEGWKWVATSSESYVGWYQIEEMKAARLYPDPGFLSDTQTERFDALSEQAETDALSEADEAELSELQHLLEGSYSDIQKALSGVLIHVDQSGQLCTCAGLVAKEDRAAAEAAGILTPSGHGDNTDVAQSAFSAKLRQDLDHIACGARQNAILDHPDLLLDLLAFQLSGRMGYRSSFGLRCDRVHNSPDKETGYVLDPRLSKPKATLKDPHKSDLARGFRAFRKQGAQKIRAGLTRQLAALLDVEDEKLGALIDKEIKTSIRSVWTPNAENFFSRVRGPMLDDLHQDLLGLKPSHPSVTTFARLKKGEKATRLEQLFGDTEFRKAHALTDKQLAHIDAWVPEQDS